MWGEKLPVPQISLCLHLYSCSTMLPDTSKKSCHKTPVLKGMSNPEFNHTMVYNSLRPEDLGEVCVEITVWDHERLSNSFLGGLRLGLGKGESHV